MHLCLTPYIHGLGEVIDSLQIHKRILLCPSRNSFSRHSTPTSFEGPILRVGQKNTDAYNFCKQGSVLCTNRRYIDLINVCAWPTLLISTCRAISSQYTSTLTWQKRIQSALRFYSSVIEPLRFTPPLCLGLTRTIYHMYTVYVRYFWQGNHQYLVK
jgi:hypothetical protein